MVVCSVACAYVAPKSNADESVIENGGTNSATNPNNVQGFGASQQQAPKAGQQAAPAAKPAAPATPKAPTAPAN